jgi:hypothetical protein
MTTRVLSWAQRERSQSAYVPQLQARRPLIENVLKHVHNSPTVRIGDCATFLSMGSASVIEMIETSDIRVSCQNFWRK